jgi:hypothetical protein
MLNPNLIPGPRIANRSSWSRCGGCSDTGRAFRVGVDGEPEGVPCPACEEGLEAARVWVARPRYYMAPLPHVTVAEIIWTDVEAAT